MARVAFMGTPDFAVPVLQRIIADGHEVIVITQPDRPAGRGRSVEMPPVKRLALEQGLTVLQPKSVNKLDFVAHLQELDPDVGVVAAFGQLLRPRLLELPPHHFLNVHASLLPRHRGASPVAAAILAGDQQTGITIMLMNEGLDTGPILAQAHCDVEIDDTTQTLEKKLSLMGANLLSQTLPLWLEDKLSPQPQNDDLATFAGRVEKTDGQVDWQKSAVTLWRMCRAYDPWPGLFTFFGEHRLRLWKVRPLPEWDGVELPGEVLSEYDDDLVIATGEGALALEEVQLAGKKRTSGADFRRGQRDLKFFL